jgi:type IV pilus assembly protein PilB
MSAKPKPISGLARRLIQDGLIELEAAEKYSLEAAKARRPLVSYLVKENIVSAEAIAAAAASEFGTAIIDLDAIDPSMIPEGLVSEQLIREHHAFPLFQRGKRLFVAVSDPTNRAALADIRFKTGIPTEEVLVREDQLTAYIEHHLGEPEEDLTDFGDDVAPVVQFVNQMLLNAIRLGSSDLHFEPFEKSYKVRFRTDGILHEVASPPVTLSPRIAARLKVMGQMDSSERRVPQDGRIKLKVSKTKSIYLRVNTLPVLFGEKIVLRILDASTAQMGIDALGYDDDQKALYLEALNKPQGMFLVTGPTGSGKTVSLYTGLNILNTPELNISTAEDPVEINLEGINQCSVNPKVGLDFSAALRSFLRQDPDIVMVGEIRDIETAEIAIKAAQTGHMVLSTLHTNSAPETITRLRNMGVPAFNLATSINLIVAQRLARRLCSCKEKIDVPATALLEKGFTQEDLDAGLEIYGPKGCDKCNGGYKGRVGVYEVVKITPEISKVIMEDGNSLEISRICQEQGFRNIYQSALLKVKQGLTSLNEVDRVTSGH